jgi:hypothetical protein
MIKLNLIYDNYQIENLSLLDINGQINKYKFT